VPDMPTVRLAARFRQGAVVGHPSGHRLRRSVPPADTRQRLAGRRTWRTFRPSGRPDIPSSMGPPSRWVWTGPDSDGQAVDTPAPSVRRCAWPAGHGRPRGLHVLALTGQDSNAHARLRPTPATTSTGIRLDITTCTYARCRDVRKPGPHPMSARFRPASTMDTTIGQPSGHRMPSRMRRTPSPPPSRHGEPEATRTGNGRTARQALGHPRSPRPQRRPAGHAEPLLWGRRLRLRNHGRLGNGNAASATRNDGSCLVSLHR
jgi:hypothetical protein